MSRVVSLKFWEVKFDISRGEREKKLKRESYQCISWIEIVFSVIDADRTWTIFAIDAVELSGQGGWADTNVDNTSGRCYYTNGRANIPMIDAWRRRDDTNRRCTFAENADWRSRDSSWWLRENESRQLLVHFRKQELTIGITRLMWW